MLDNRAHALQTSFVRSTIGRTMRRVLSAAVVIVAVSLILVRPAWCHETCEQNCDDPPCCDHRIELALVEQDDISKKRNLKLIVGCGAPLVNAPKEAKFKILNRSDDYYKVRVRMEVVCPPDPNKPDVCVCPYGFGDWFDRDLHVCNEDSCHDPSAPWTENPDWEPYPRQVDPIDAGVPCEQEGDWTWCTKVLHPDDGEELGPDEWTYLAHPLNSCCDCDRVRKNITCGQAHALEYSPTLDPWQPTDVSGDARYSPDVVECRTVADECEVTHDVENVEFTCFEPLALWCPELSANFWATPPDPGCDGDDFFMFDPNGDVSELECRIDPNIPDPWQACNEFFPDPDNTTPFLTMTDLGLGTGIHVFEVRDPDASNPTADMYRWEIVDAADPDCTEGVNFKMPKSIGGSGRQNFVALPYVNMFQGAGGPERLCEMLRLSSSATITQYDAETGDSFTHECGTTPTFELLDLCGVDIVEPEVGVKTGFLIGAEGDDPNVPIYKLGPGNKGKNLFPVLYHTTYVTPEDICEKCGLSDDASVTRIDSFAGTVHTHRCTQLPLWELVLGEAVSISEPESDRSCVQEHN